MPDAQHVHDRAEIRPLRPPRRATEPETEVPFDAEVREQPRILEHDAAAPPLRRHEDAAHGVEHGVAIQRHAAALRAQQARDGGDHGALAAARRAEQRRDTRGGRGEDGVQHEAAAAPVRIGRPRPEAVPEINLERHQGWRSPRPSSRPMRRAITSASRSPATANTKDTSASRAAVTSPPGICVAL